MRSAFKLKPSKGTKKVKRSVRRTKKVSEPVKSYIKKELAKNIENKVSINVDYSGSILTLQRDNAGTLTYNYGIFNPYANNQFAINQGVAMNERIGNRIKLKKWIMKGTIYVDPESYASNNLGVFSQGLGYIDYYLGRKNNLAEQITTDLEFLYQNGPTATTPTAQLEERLYSINKDQYKIYYHKRVKIGQSSYIGIGTGFPVFPPNNDYKLNHEFKIDICKLVCKNHIIKYEDGNNTAEDALLQSLTMFATITMPSNDPNTSVIPIPGTSYSPVRWFCTSYIEYEDA